MCSCIRPSTRLAGLAAAASALLLAVAGAAAQAPAAPSRGDYIIAVVNQELVTNGEVEQRIARVRDNAARANATLPPLPELRRQVLDSLIDERVQITYARNTGQKIDEAELDRAVNNVAVQNQVSPTQLRDRLRAEGIDYQRFRNGIKDQMLVERVREHEVQSRIQVSDEEIDDFLAQQRAKAAGSGSSDLNIAQILVTVPEGASDAVVAERRARAEAARKRVQGGESFEAVAKEISEDGNRAQGGVIGMRPADKLPDVFVEQVKPLKAGEISPTLLRSGAGFHVLKLVERTDAGTPHVTQTHARHILLRLSPQLTQDAAQRRLAGFKREIESGARTFEQLARDNSEDGSAPTGGDLGWATPGSFVPEFEEAMNALPVGGISDPVVSRFGVHLLQVIERRQLALTVKQQRDQARNVLREQKFEEAYAEWVRSLRDRAYIEMREPPA